MARRSVKLHEVDGCIYKSASMVDVHNELKQNKEIQSFRLPEVRDKMRRGKYGSLKATVNGILFDSIMEARYYAHLLTLKKKKQIKSFSQQVTFNLIPKFKDKLTGKSFRALDYIADFVVERNDGTKLVVDIKGKKTPEFKIKEKVFHYTYQDVEFRCIQWDSFTDSWRVLDDIEKDARQRKRDRKKLKN